MNYQDDVKVGEMVEGKKYPVHQGQGYSTGVWITKKEDELILKHFWDKGILDYNDRDSYYYDETDGVCYLKEDTTAISVIHKDIMQVVEDAIEYDFNDITLEFVYDVIYIGYIHNDLMCGESKLPLHLKNSVKFYNEKGKEIEII